MWSSIQPEIKPLPSEAPTLLPTQSSLHPKISRGLVINRNRAAFGLDLDAATATSSWLPHPRQCGGTHDDRAAETACHARRTGRSCAGPSAARQTCTGPSESVRGSVVLESLGDHARSSSAHRQRTA